MLTGSLSPIVFFANVSHLSPFPLTLKGAAPLRSILNDEKRLAHRQFKGARFCCSFSKTSAALNCPVQLFDSLFY
jgi:hypothetical protein